MPSALVVVDVQQGLFAGKAPPYRGDDLLQSIARLLARARAAGAPVFHVRHDGGPGHPLARGSAGWPHHPAVAPQAGEAIVDKRQSSAFHDTDFHARLQASAIDRLVVAGIQTEMCVESRAARRSRSATRWCWCRTRIRPSTPPCCPPNGSSRITTIRSAKDLRSSLAPARFDFRPSTHKSAWLIRPTPACPPAAAQKQTFKNQGQKLPSPTSAGYQRDVA